MANIVTLSGTVFRPEKRYTSNNVAMLSFRLSFYAGKDKDKNTRYGSIYVRAFRDLAENAAASIRDKHRVVVSGRLNEETWEKDGVKYYGLVIIAEDIAIPFSVFPADGSAPAETAPRAEETIREEDIPF